MTTGDVASVRADLVAAFRAARESDDLAVSRQLRVLDRLAEETASPRIAFFARSRRAMNAITVGTVDEAAALVEEVFALGESLAEADVRAVTHSLLAELLRRRGDRE